MPKSSIDKLNDAFDTTFKEDIDQAEKDIEQIEERKNALVKQVETKEMSITFQDQQYMLMELKTLIQSTTNVLDKLEQDIRIGSPPRMYEVYATLTNSKTMQLKELRELNKMILEMSIFKEDEKDSGGQKLGKDSVTMTTKGLLDIIKQAQKENSMNKVEVEFDILENEKEKDK